FKSYSPTTELIFPPVRISSQIPPLFQKISLT
ncbi:unnamed protein product, partial [Diplocarpon coronariae]